MASDDSIENDEDEISEEEKRILDERLAEYKRNPNRGIPLDVAMEQLRRKHIRHKEN
jgi:putative addiction module component (TIGR02574 family)